MRARDGGMWRHSHRLVLGVCITGMIALCSLVISGCAGAHAQQQAQEDPVVGTWLVTESNNPTRNLDTFLPGGVFVSTGSNLFTPPPAPIRFRTTRQGVWRRTGPHEVDYTFMVFLFDAQGTFVGTNKIRAHLTLNQAADAYTVVGRFQRFDPDGNPVASGSEALRGTRMVVEPLSPEELKN